MALTVRGKYDKGVGMKNLTSGSSVGQTIRKARTAMGMSQAELSRRLGLVVGSGYVSRVEAGGKVPSVLMVMKLADVLGVGVAVLMELARAEYEEATLGRAYRRYRV